MKRAPQIIGLLCRSRSYGSRTCGKKALYLVEKALYRMNKTPFPQIMRLLCRVLCITQNRNTKKRPVLLKNRPAKETYIIQTENRKTHMSKRHVNQTRVVCDLFMCSVWKHDAPCIYLHTIYMHVYIYRDIHLCDHMHVYVCTCIYIYIYICIYIYTKVYMYIYMYIHVYTQYTYMCTKWAYVFTVWKEWCSWYIYTDMNIYNYVYLYIYIHVYT